MDRLADVDDPSLPQLQADRPARIARGALVTAVGLAGVAAAHHPMLLSGFRKIQTDLGDSRLLNYLLEHGWLWARRTPGHERFWDAPFFHPVPNVIAFSDSMLSYGPLYWPMRLAGLAPDTAFGAFLIAATALNYAAGVLLFRKGLGFGAPATAAGAGLIAFGAPRVNQLGHAQLVPFFYQILALYALCRIFRAPKIGAGERAACWVAIGLAVAAQLYGGVYLGWFFGVGLAFTAAAAIVLKLSRDAVLEVARRDWWAAATGALVAAVALIPFLTHYLPAAREFGSNFNQIQIYAHPTTESWWSLGEGNWMWGWVERRWPLKSNPFPWEHHLGIGYLTTAACGVGLYLGRGRPLIRVALATMLLGLATMTMVPGPQVANLAAVAVCFALGCLFREPDWSERGAAAFALATAFLLTASPFNDVMRTLTVVMMVFCFVRVASRPGLIDKQFAPASILAILALNSLAIPTAATMAGVLAPPALLFGFYQPARRRFVTSATIGLVLASAIWLTFESRPWILTGAALGAALGWAAGASERLRPSAVWQLRILLVAFPLVILLYGHNSLWLACSPWIPGSQAIRVPCRVVLIMVLPAALGIAAMVQRLDRGRWGAAAWGLALLCLAEQTGTTKTYDVALSRARIDDVARRIDPSAESFYYRPENDELFMFYGVDAMWAGIEAGVPTINGYSGGFPTGWWALPMADSPHEISTEAALREWSALKGLDRSRIQRIGRQAGNEVPASPPVDDEAR
ncbi:hypothetical protein [Paludisphaera mucosa]|uniref:Glycosyltransferase RgtA/B/C/D-like domain-containing protein n=1 Tax=Paludisphaera mucosa TaxID=3030827 RepID=A0ABT6F7C6_9BACT|nr:hypothetical protein [Paludisphaera mucosa]MDG3003437.1 hypothetical protein [Paludisphaera mucosa]